ncbi:MAG: hypothetical protein K0R53_3312, partial [Burkholderiales bacterium]|nr:hypothetical protein [Burkholderiales bacterium]
MAAKTVHTGYMVGMVGFHSGGSEL